jgi:HTH-type transcriptional regulator, competence development regulator
MAKPPKTFFKAFRVALETALLTAWYNIFAKYVKRTINSLDKLSKYGIPAGRHRFWAISGIGGCMRGKKITQTAQGQSLADYLLNIRTMRKFTLREVEEASEHMVSNAYLSQLEHGRINKPSPNILHALANVYGVPYEVLMDKAGYITAVNRNEGKDQRRVATFAGKHLTQEEEEDLLKYLAFLRSRKLPS